MKKFIQSIVARALCILALGILLVVFSERVTTWIVMVCGVLFIIPGSVALVSHFARNAENRRMPLLYPVVGTGSILFGLVLLLWPGLFIEALMYLLAAFLLIASGTQFYTLWDIRRGGIRSSFFYYVVPTLEMAGGLFILLSDRKEAIAGLPMIVIGSGFIIYALLELWTVYLLKKSPVPDKDLLVLP